MINCVITPKNSLPLPLKRITKCFLRLALLPDRFYISTLLTLGRRLCHVTCLSWLNEQTRGLSHSIRGSRRYWEVHATRACLANRKIKVVNGGCVCRCVICCSKLSVKQRLLRPLVWKPRRPSSFDGLSSVQSYPHLIVWLPGISSKS